jgi:hypothetical protein
VHAPPPLDPRRVRAIVAGNAFGFDEAGPTGGGGRDPAVPGLRSSLRRCGLASGE